MLSFNLLVKQNKNNSMVCIEYTKISKYNFKIFLITYREV